MDTRRTRYIVEAVIVVGIVGYARFEHARANRERLGRLNAVAAADSTRRWYDGQLQVATRLVIQGQVQLAKALRAPGRATTAATVAIAPPPVTAQTTGIAEADTLHGALDTIGVHIKATVVAPAWSWWVERDPVLLQVGLSCDAGAARATVSGPRWAQLTLTDLHQDPAVCNPPPRWAPFSLRPPSLLWLGGAFAAGWVLAH